MPFREPFKPRQIKLRHLHRGDVEAELRPTRTADAAIWARDWQPVLRHHAKPAGEWPWEAHITRAEVVDGYLTLAVVRDGALDALMSLTEKREESRLVPGRKVTYIEFIGVAPEHQDPPIGERMIKGLGRTMLEVASQIGILTGGNGLIGLHSKPEVEDFYRKLRLHECAKEQCEDGAWRYFETCEFWLRGENLRQGKVTT